MKQCNLMRRKQSRFQKIYLPSRELKISAFEDNLKAATRDIERRDIDECLERVVAH